MPNWTIVTTVSAPFWIIALHARYHSSLGAATPIYFLDAPHRYSREQIHLLAQYGNIVQCDQKYWDSVGGRPDKTVDRQMVNIQVARKLHGSAWILHIDIDEFLHLGDNDLGNILDLPPEISEVRIENVERVLAFSGQTWTDGYLRVRTRQRHLLEKHYGSNADFFGFGMSNYFHGKSLVRHGERFRQSLHGALQSDPNREIIRFELNRREAMVVHYPCITPSHFAGRYISFLKSGQYDTAEFRHQQIFRNYLLSEARTLGVRDALIKCLKELHYGSPEQVLARMEDGLYEAMPGQFLDRLNDCALDSLHINLVWADKSFSAYQSLA